MSNTQVNLIVKEEGICIYREPEEPKNDPKCHSNYACGCADMSFDNGANRDVVDFYDDNCPHKYDKALKQAQSSAILCEDQERASDLLEPFLLPIRVRLAKEKQVSESYIASYGLDKKEAIGKSYPVPGIEFKEIEIVWYNPGESAWQCKQDDCKETKTVARLIEQKESPEIEELTRDSLMHEWGNDTDGSEPFDWLLKNFNLTRKP